jgi:hypothetical protein
VKKLIEKLECKVCANALYTTTPPDYDKRFVLIKLRDNGGLTYPSSDVLKLEEITERVLRRYLAACNGKPTNRKNTKQLVLAGVLSHTCNTSLFENLHAHMFDTEVTDNHIHKLCRSIINKYLEVRFHHEAKSFTSEIRGQNIRNKLTKTILLKNQ